jgi:protein O-GlcNAc transferase
MGDLALARACFEAALRLRPDHVAALFDLGNLLQEMGYAEKAVSLHQQAHQRAPRRPDILNNLGTALMACEKRARRSTASSRFSRLTQVSPTP